MSRVLHVSMGSIAIAAVMGLAAGGAGAATAHGAAALAPTPLLKSTVTKGQVLTLTGPRSFRPGRVALSLKAGGTGGSVDVVSFKKGYSFAQLHADLTTFGASDGPNGPSPAGIKALDTAVAHTNIFGGLQADPGTSVTGTVVLPVAGTYYLYNDLNAPIDPQKLTVTGTEAQRAKPPSTATVTAMSDDRFGGAAKLPATGTITFKNVSSVSPHFLSLQHVKQGTTRAQVLASLMSNGEPSFVRKGDVNADFIGPGHAMTLNYSLPKGEYVEVCFFPDLKTGIPHAFMGMIRIVQLG